MGYGVIDGVASPFPMRRIDGTGEDLKVNSIPGAVPPQQYYEGEPTLTNGYAAVARVSESEAIALNIRGDMQRIVFEEDGLPSIVGESFSPTIDSVSSTGLSSAPVIDRPTGVYVGINQVSSRLLAFDSERVVRSQELTQASSAANRLQPFVRLSDGGS